MDRLGLDMMANKGELCSDGLSCMASHDEHRTQEPCPVRRVNLAFSS